MMTTEVVPAKALEVRLARHLRGAITPAVFDVTDAEIREPADDELVVRYDYLSIATPMVDLMRKDVRLPMPPYEVGKRLWGFAVGTVVVSRSKDFEPGDEVLGQDGWGEYTVGPASGFTKTYPGMFPQPNYYLSQGPTAYHGMVDIAEVGEGDTVYVTGAAGGVGSLAGQIAKCRGAKRVIGAAGSAAKVKWLVNELGFDAAFNYKDGPVVDQLAELAPDGIDVFFDNVGGEHFEAAVQAAAPNARFALCGVLGAQLGDSRKKARAGAPRLDILTGILKQIVIKPFSTYHTPEQIQAWMEHFGQWLKEGKFVFPNTVVKGGIEAAPQALVDLTQGKYKGNVSVKLS